MKEHVHFPMETYLLRFVSCSYLFRWKFVLFGNHYISNTGKIHINQFCAVSGLLMCTIFPLNLLYIFRMISNSYVCCKYVCFLRPIKNCFMYCIMELTDYNYLSISAPLQIVWRKSQLMATKWLILSFDQYFIKSFVLDAFVTSIMACLSNFLL